LGAGLQRPGGRHRGSDRHRRRGPRLLGGLRPARAYVAAGPRHDRNGASPTPPTTCSSSGGTLRRRCPPERAWSAASHEIRPITLTGIRRGNTGSPTFAQQPP
jgi:hypothetical protein